jgi:hypothetical protein
MDIMLGAELRRVTRLVDIANTMPMWERPQYLMERLPMSPAGPGSAKDQSRCSSAGLEPRPAGIYGEIGADVPQRLEYH